MMHRISRAAVLALTLMGASEAWAGLSFAPYASIKSTKSVTPGKKDQSTENEVIKQRNEYGIRASLSFWRLFKTQLSVGQSKLTTTQKTSQVKDEYGEIDLNTELNMDTSDPDQEVRLTETQNVGKFSLIIDPSFSIFIARFKLGITARQRIITKDGDGIAPEKVVDGPTYKPHSGVGFGIRFTPRMFFMAEYEVYHYMFPPKVQPFERELSVSYNVSI